MTGILSLNMVIALVVLVALLAGRLAYAALDREFDLHPGHCKDCVIRPEAADVRSL